METSSRVPGVTDDELAELRALVDREYDNYLDDLRTLVNIDCGSYTKAGVDRVGRWTGRFLERLGARVEYQRDQRLGDVVVGVFDGRPEGPRLLLVGHMDTVFDAGTVDVRPFRTGDGRAYGPGVIDMKAGLLAGLYALLVLRAAAEQSTAIHADGAGEGGPRRQAGAEAPWMPFQRVVFVANPDEEIGSPISTPVIQLHARESDVALVLECARANGDIVSARKGVLDLSVTLRGRAAHAGVEPEKGRSAVLEAAHKTIALHELAGRWPGLTCNVGVIRGGTRPNVVAEDALLEVDIRALTRASMEAADAEVRAICERTTVPGVTSTVEERARHWPMERSAAAAHLVAQATALAGRLGFGLADTATGGASDANTTAGLGVPTLDGLGPVGGNGHSADEYLELSSIVPRVTLLAALLLAIARDDALRTVATSYSA